MNNAAESARSAASWAADAASWAADCADDWDASRAVETAEYAAEYAASVKEKGNE